MDDVEIKKCVKTKYYLFVSAIEIVIKSKTMFNFKINIFILLTLLIILLFLNNNYNNCVYCSTSVYIDDRRLRYIHLETDIWNDILYDKLPEDLILQKIHRSHLKYLNGNFGEKGRLFEFFIPLENSYLHRKPNEIDPYEKLSAQIHHIVTYINNSVLNVADTEEFNYLSGNNSTNFNNSDAIEWSHHNFVKLIDDIDILYFICINDLFYMIANVSNLIFSQFQ